MSYVQGILGILVFVGLGFALSEDRKKIPWKMVIAAILLQFVLALILTYAPIVSRILLGFNKLIMTLDTATRDGSSFVFGYLGGANPPFEIKNPAGNFIIAFQILPIIIVVSALSSLLFHWGVLQKVISLFSLLLKKVLKTDGATAMGVASSIFLGIIESPLFIKPYLKSISRSGLFTLITAGMATVAGTVMALYANVLNNIIPNAAGQILIASVLSAPAAIMIAQILIPPEDTVADVEEIKLESKTSSAFEAIINGTTEGISMVISISGVLLVLFAFISLINMALGLIPLETPLTIQQIVGYVFAPFCWLMGIDPSEIVKAGQLMGIKVILNEFVSYTQLAASPTLSAKTKIILTYAMCGFANFGSLGILIGGLGTIIPERKNEVVSLSFRAILAGTMATMLTGSIIGILN